MTAGWRECADPVELAAAVAAGVEVRWNNPGWPGAWGQSTASSEASFAAAMRGGNRYRVPASWSWSPEPPAPDDLVSRARRHAETHPESRELIEELLEELLEAVVRWACFAAPPPVPPWPGAVLSGLTDEDGVPTWLAQAGQVRGEQVRRRSDFAWVNNDQMVAHLDTVWVEVRAPRTVPVPETERVNVLDAIRNRIELTHPEGEFLAVGVELREDGDLVAIEQQEPWGKAQPVAPDGTVEVLKDGDR